MSRTSRISFAVILEKTRRFEVRTENRSAQALAVALDFRPDLILLDVDMPGTDGAEVARQMGAQPTLKETPILFLTSLISRTEAGGREVVRGGKRFLAKPVNPKVLVEAIDRILGVAATPP